MSDINSEFLNIDDVDPISLTPICEVTTGFEYRSVNDQSKAFWFDAWAWLEYLCACPGKYIHPLTREDLYQTNNFDIYLACVTSGEQETDPYKQELLRKCKCTRLIKDKIRDSDGQICSLSLIPESPIYRLQIIDYKKSSDLTTSISCFAKITYQLFDVENNPVTKLCQLHI